MTCKQTPYGCCTDGVNSAKGPNQEGCPVAQPNQVQRTKCQQEQDQATNGAVDIFIPDCKPNGQYNDVQCYTFPGTGKTQCWCVDVDSGVERQGTRLDEQQPDCLNPPTTTATTTTAVTQPSAVPPLLVICMVTVFRCCPDGVTAAKGPNNQGCASLTTPPPPVEETSPTVPQGNIVLSRLYF